MKLLLALLVFAFLGWLAVNALLRWLRGQPAPSGGGRPRTITLVCIVLVAVYGVLIVWRLHTQGWAIFG